jgi:hypothetical protein
MTEELLLQEFEALAERLAIPVIYADVEDGQGGLCQIRGENRFILQRKLDIRTRNDIFARAFAGMPIDGVFVVPHVRDRIDVYRSSEA